MTSLGRSRALGFGFWLLVCSVGAVVAWQLFSPPVYTNDSTTYLLAARKMLGQDQGRFLYFRTLGYPVVLGITGVTSMDSFAILWGVQSAMAVSIPLLLYRAIAPASERAGRWAGVVALATTVPFVFSKAVMTQQAYVFLQVVGLYAAARLAASPRSRYIFGLAGCAIGLSLLRPAGARTVGLWLVLIIGTHIYRRRCPRRMLADLAVAVAGILLAGTAVAAYQARISEDFMPGWRAAEAESSRGGTALGGRILFYKTYIAARHLGKEMFVTAENGRNSARLARRIEAFYRQHPERAKAIFGPAAESIPLAEGGWFLRDPSGARFYAGWVALDADLGADRADALFLSAALEAIRHHPSLALWFGKQFVVALLGLQMMDEDGTPVYALPTPFVEQRPNSAGLSSGLNMELLRAPFTPLVQRVYRMWGWYFLAFQSLLAFTALATLPFGLSGRDRLLVGIATVTWLSEFVAVAVFAFPLTHYVAFGTLPLLVAAVLGIRCAYGSSVAPACGAGGDGMGTGVTQLGSEGGERSCYLR